MSDLDVGDISIRGTRVSIRSAPADAQARVDIRPLAWLATVPVPALVFAFVGIVVAGAGLVAALANMADGLAAAITHGGFLVPIGLGLISAGILASWARRHQGRVAALALGRTVEPRAELVQRLLAEAPGGLAVRALVQATGWSEPEVVATLGQLRRHGIVREDFNESVGDYVYVADQEPLDLDQRINTSLRRIT